MSIPTTNPIKIPRTATPIAIPANCPEEKARYELDEQLFHITTYVTQLMKIKCDEEGCNTLEKSEATLKKGWPIKASYQLCSLAQFNFTD